MGGAHRPCGADRRSTEFAAGERLERAQGSYYYAGAAPEAPSSRTALGPERQSGTLQAPGQRRVPRPSRGRCARRRTRPVARSTAPRGRSPWRSSAQGQGAGGLRPRRAAGAATAAVAPGPGAGQGGASASAAARGRRSASHVARAELSAGHTRRIGLGGADAVLQRGLPLANLHPADATVAEVRPAPRAGGA